jgi:hypothetical protein
VSTRSTRPPVKETRPNATSTFANLKISSEWTLRQPIVDYRMPPSSNATLAQVGDDETEKGSVADSDDWIEGDERASNSVAPSIASELDYRHHRLLMQQPPKGIILSAPSI